jgi:hypothetical protein
MPTTVEEWNNRLKLYMQPCQDYFVRMFTSNGDCYDALNLFRQFRIVDPVVVSEENLQRRDIQVHVDCIFEKLKYISNLQDNDKRTFKEGLLAEFPALKNEHEKFTLESEIEVNEIVEVEVANYAIPRIARVTSITNDGNNFNVEFIGKINNNEDNADLRENNVPRIRVDKQITSYLSYYNSLRSQFPNWFRLICIVVLFQPSSAAAERVFSQMTAMFRKNQDGTYQDSVWATCALRTMLESNMADFFFM